MNLSYVETALQYQFNDQSLIKQALTHNSFSSQHYQRLEFLGDAVLQLLISEQLIAHFPEANEGLLSQMRSQLVRGSELAALFLELGLENQIRVGKGLTQIDHKQAVLADVFEAVLAAIYLDGGYAQADIFIRRVFKNRLETFRLEGVRKDAKTTLQEFLQSQGKSLPVYKLLAEIGHPPETEFKISCQLKDYEISIETIAKNRKEAEQLAAGIALQKLNALDAGICHDN